ncbi:hypothetical protein OVY01_12095 [Robbsia sp. Bb-Pol-6]|uniref:Uncharacterized protein n=1 Tax=Robbsia betulipollinis TaxID=2981849 RepID=A0ABT3ZN66_9BURK|nr:hypothetical protein [Robbsia betulipollinis]MCY0387964.1 hypothetical protein [Robbsia betulipollinis]
MTPSDIIDHFEHAWKRGDLLSTTAQLDQYVIWISEHWETLSAREREVMLSVGAAVFRQWMSGAGSALASSCRDDAQHAPRDEGIAVMCER